MVMKLDKFLCRHVFVGFFGFDSAKNPGERHTFFARIINQKFRLIYSSQLICEPKAKDCARSRSINIYCNSTVLAFEADHFPYIKIQLTNSLLPWLSIASG